MSVLVRNSAGGGGYDFTARINVTYPPEAVVTCSLGDRTYTDSSRKGSHKFRVHKAGTWIVKAVSGSKESTREVVIETNGQVVNIDLSFSQIFGITRDINSSSPKWARTDKAVGMTATASVGPVAGHSDFDNCLPWSGMKRETLSTGDVMVKIPKFWYQRYRTGDIETIKIANAPVEGFAVHPAFNHGGIEKDCIYVGAYKTSSFQHSKSKTAPSTYGTRGRFRYNAKQKGDGWNLIDVSTQSAIQMLILVEFATNDVQRTIGMGYTHNRSVYTYTGSCDNVPNLTGRPSNSDSVLPDGDVDVVYRGIEGLWGNINEWVDGINFYSYGREYYICNDPMQYADDTKTNYDALSYPLITTVSGYIERVGLDPKNSHAMFPTNVGDASNDTCYCDIMYYGIDYNSYPLAAGGTYGDSYNAGMFYSRCNLSYSTEADDIGSRLIYIPQ